jgi:anhydro-N-acetylmuramic acid kinase
MHTPRLVAGAMSGTSADGVDVAVVRICGSGYEMSAELVTHHHRPYPAELRQTIFAIRSAGSAKLAELAELAREISLVYAATVNEALLSQGLAAGDLACVAAHGQTLFHQPPVTIQWLDPALLAAEVGCPVVSDFRRADCALGGQGAPLVPFADYILFRDAKKDRVLVNIGGIANLTYIPAGADLEWLIAFDTGPGNCVSDWLCRRLEPEGLGFDMGGRRAQEGQVIQAIVDRMLKASYFWQRPPKSTDGPAMIELFCESVGGRLESHILEDLLATASCITGKGLAQSIFQFLPDEPDEVIVSGGGMHNRAIMDCLRRELGGIRVLTTDELGLRSEAKEAMAFALLGAATLDGVPGNVPAVTGARRAVVLGAVTPKP